MSALAGAENASPQLEGTGQTDGIPPSLLDELWQTAKGHDVGLTPAELEQVLLVVGRRHNFSQGHETTATPAQREYFYRGLQLTDLALAHACSLGREGAWQIFVERYRDDIERAAVGIMGSLSLGKELADSLYSELFGLTEREGQRRSPLTSYSGRGSLMGWLRATLAQRCVDHHRRTHRESPIEEQDFAASETPAMTPPKTLDLLARSLTEILRELGQEERFLLSAYFLDQRTLLEIACVLRVHEATVSRRLKRLTTHLHKRLLKHLEACGMSKGAAKEALGADPRDIDLNLRTVLQTSAVTPFSQQQPSTDGTR